MMSVWISFVLRPRSGVLLAVVLTAGLAIFAGRGLRVQFQARDFYDYPKNEDLPALKRASADFGDPAGNVVVLLKAPNVFDGEVLSYIKVLTDEIATKPSFSHVDSLTHVRAVRGDKDEVTSGPLADPVPTTPEALEILRRFATHEPMLVHRLVSSDTAVGEALRAVGPAAIFTSVILSAGFSVLMLSRFGTLRVLGLLSMVTLLTAVLADIVVSPVLFRLLLNWQGEGRAADATAKKEAAMVAG